MIKRTELAKVIIPYLKMNNEVHSEHLLKLMNHNLDRNQ